MAIESVLSQTFGDFTLLISDNCSTDDTEEICRSLARSDARIVYTRTNQNIGAAGNYSRLVRLASGQYFKWISHDDSMSPEFIETCLAVADGHPEIISVAPIVEMVDAEGVVVQSTSSYLGYLQWPHARLRQYQMMMDELTYCETHSDGVTMVTYQYAFHRRDLLLRTRLVMPFISSDYVLAAELALFGRLVKLDVPLSRFALTGGTSSNFVAWNPAAIQRMLSPMHAGRLDMMMSVRRRHFEHLHAVLRSPLTGSQKLLALEAATRPARGRFAARMRQRSAGASHGD